jgi:Uma2 family endonuclease
MSGLAAVADAIAATLDQHVVLYDAGWETYEALLRTRGESARPRITFFCGVLELMSPSSNHEIVKTLIARLVEAYAEEHDLPLNGFGSWTLKRRRKKAGAEPDECYSLGERGRVPDLAIEVVWTRTAVDKLEVYHALGVPEVWIWERSKIRVHLLRDAGYVRANRSALLPGLDLALLAGFLGRTDQTRAVREFRAALHAKTSRPRGRGRP